MASTYLQRTQSAGNRRTFTLSFWVKKTRIADGDDDLFFFGTDGTGSITKIEFSSDKFQFVDSNYSSTGWHLTSSQVFRDVNAWYHVVIAIDTTQADSANRAKIYINGEQITSFDTNVRPAQNYDCFVNTASQVLNIGRGFNFSSTTALYFDGSMTHVHFIDGTAYDASAFGEVDSTTNIWKAKTAPSVTYGTNGFFLKFENSGSMGTDSSGNGNNFTVNGTMTQTVDTPSNVFATMNAIGNYTASTTLSNGNNTVAMTTSKGGNLSTLGFTKGKYYAEMKIATMPTDSRFHIGLLPQPITIADDPIATGNDGIMLSGFNAVIYANSGAGSAILDNFYGNATGRFSGNPILGLAVDLSSATKTIAISIDGAWVTGSNTTDSDFANALKVDITTPLARWSDWFMGCGSGNGTGTTGVYNWNFGNGYFGTTAVSSAQNPDDGIGIFEYDVPTGYRALCTKSINAQEYS